eukprot:1150678-Pelagomonas_calceolata.AAC.1
MAHWTESAYLQVSPRNHACPCFVPTTTELERAMAKMKGPDANVFAMAKVLMLRIQPGMVSRRQMCGQCRKAGSAGLSLATGMAERLLRAYLSEYCQHTL